MKGHSEVEELGGGSVNHPLIYFRPVVFAARPEVSDVCLMCFRSEALRS